MSRIILIALGLSLLVFALGFTGIWKGAGDLGIALFGLTLVLALLGIVNDSDKPAR